MTMRPPVLLLSALLLAGCAGSAPRTVEDLLAHSRRNLERSSPRELSGFDPVMDWGPLLWLERSIEDPDSQDRPLFLHGLSELRPEELESILAMRAGRVFLPDLEQLDAALTAVLARHPHEVGRGPGKELYLDGLVRLDPAAARALVAYAPAVLSLGGLDRIEPELARVLAGTPQALHLRGLTRLELPLAGALAAWEGWGEQVFLSLRGLREIEPPVLVALAACRGWGLDLSGLQRLSPEAARALGALDNPYLALDGLTEIDLDTARVIATWERKFLSLDGLRSITPEVRALIEGGTEAVSLRSLPR